MMLADLGRRIISVKNRDYGDHDEKVADPFANLRMDGAYGIVVRMQDKVSRLRTWAKTGRLSVADESFVDTAIDLINYAAILVAYQMDEGSRESRSATIPPR